LYFNSNVDPVPPLPTLDEDNSTVDSAEIENDSVSIFITDLDVEIGQGFGLWL
jgi:hypothetical protein